MRHGSAREIRDTLAARGLSLKKRWGQNFLLNNGARESIIRAVDPHPDEVVWEIGGGMGSITELLVESVAMLVVFEIDHGLVDLLRERYGGERCRIVAGDFCRTWREVAESGAQPHKVVGNLPYRSASRIIASLIEGAAGARRTVVTVQRELARRMRAGPGSPDYSSFSVLCGVAYDIREHAVLQGGSFHPPPRVESSVLLLLPRPDAPDPGEISTVARALFAHRRKTLRNNLAASSDLAERAGEVLDILREIGHGPSDRPGDLAVEDFIEIARRLRGGAD